MRRRKVFFKLTLAISACLAVNSANAITTIEGNAGLQFSFNNPGARSLGMGGAFLGLADDATAAYTNPAGLSNLSRPEFSLEYRNTDYTTVYSDLGRLYGTPSGLGIDTVSGIVQEETSEDVNALSFISYVYPMEKWTIGAYRHQLADFKAGFESQGPIIQTRELVGDLPFLSRANPSINNVDLNIINWGLSASFRVGDSVSIGAGVSYYDLDFDTTTQRFFLPSGLEGRWSLVDFDELDESSFTTQRGDDTAWGFSLGLLWSINEKWSAGFVYKQGVEFDYAHEVTLSSGRSPSGITDLNVPGLYGGGITYRATERFTLSLDINRISYSDITKNVVLQGGGAPVDYLAVDDGTEYRLGGEYVFDTKHYFSLRAGVWYDPEHVIVHVGEQTPVTPDDPDRIYKNTSNTRAAFFQPGDDQMHYSLGTGMVWKKLQLDAAVDFSDQVRTFSLSGVVFF
jgi:long-chain fatty acid transport protein